MIAFFEVVLRFQYAQNSSIDMVETYVPGSLSATARVAHCWWSTTVFTMAVMDPSLVVLRIMRHECIN